jgi:hypothetical protein
MEIAGDYERPKIVAAKPARAKSKEKPKAHASSQTCRLKILSLCL